MRNIVIILALLMLTGCAGKHCVSVGGEYQGATGNVEYCYDTGQSEAAGSPAFSDGEKTSYLLDEDTINGIIDKIKEKVGISAMSVSPKNEEHPMVELRRLLEEE